MSTLAAATTGGFWHRELPPIDAEMMAEHFVEANSSRVPGTLAHRDKLVGSLLPGAHGRCPHSLRNFHHGRDIMPYANGGATTAPDHMPRLRGPHRRKVWPCSCY